MSGRQVQWIHISLCMTDWTRSVLKVQTVRYISSSSPTTHFNPSNDNQNLIANRKPTKNCLLGSKIKFLKTVML